MNNVGSEKKYIVNKLISTLMFIKSRIKEKICTEWKYYPWIMLKFSVLIPLFVALVLFFIQNNMTDGVAKNILDFLWKASVGFAVKDIVGLFSGHKDIETLLRLLNTTYIKLTKIKRQIETGQSTRMDQIDYLRTDISSVVGEYNKDYDVPNLEYEFKYIEDIKSKLDTIEDLENRRPLLFDLNRHLNYLEVQQGYPDIRSITGTSETQYFIPPNK